MLSATILSGNVDLADVMFLIAVILFAAATALAVTRRDAAGILVAGGLTAAAFGVLLL